MSKLTLHQLLYLIITGILYSVIHVSMNLELKSLTVGVVFTTIWMTVWDFLFLKRPEWKDKYQGQ